MAIFSNTKIQLRHKLAYLMNDLVLGTVSSAAAGSFVCATTDWEKADEFFEDFVEVYDYSGTGAGTSAKPKTWTNSSHTLTFLPAATLTDGDLVEMHRRFTVAEYNNAINHAIDQVAMDALVDRVDESIALTAGTYQYNLPTQFLYIDDIWISDTNGVWGEQVPLDPKYWRPIKTTTLTLEFIRDVFKPVTGTTVRIVGMASPSILETDTETTPVDPEYIIQAAKAFLHQSRIRGADKDSEFHAQQMQIAATLAAGSRREMQTNRTGRAIVEA
jgi:hypothetical protein